MIGNAPCSSIYRMRWANYLEDSMIRRRLNKSTVPMDIRENLCEGREFQVSTAIEWNYEIRHRNLVEELGHSGNDHPVRVVAGATSSNFIKEMSIVVPHTTYTPLKRIGDQYLPVWKWKDCNDQLVEFANNHCFPKRNVVDPYGTGNGTGNGNGAGEMMYVDALRREKSANVW